MSRLTVGSLEGLSENSNVISVPTGHKLNVTDVAGLQIGGTAINAQIYTPVLTNWTSTSVIGRYIQIGKLVHVFFEASGTITCSGIMRVSLPLAAAASNRLNGHHGIMLEAGVAWYPCMTTGFSTTQFDIYAMTQSGSSVRWLPTSASSPFSWGVSDAVSITFTYEAA